MEKFGEALRGWLSEQNIFRLLRRRGGLFRRARGEIGAVVGGLDFAAVARAPLAEGIDRVVGAVAAEFLGFAALEDFDFLRAVVAKNVGRFRRGGGNFGLGEDVAAGGAGGFLSDLREAVVLRLPQQEADAPARGTGGLGWFGRTHGGYYTAAPAVRQESAGEKPLAFPDSIAHLFKCAVVPHAGRGINMDQIVAACRIVANPSRLALLHVIYTQPWITAQALAIWLGSSGDVVSHELKLLRTIQLVTTRPRGRYVLCAPAVGQHMANRFLHGLQELLSPVLAGRDLRRTLGQVCGPVASASWPAVWENLEKIFTAYTHPRRLLLLRYLVQHKMGTSDTLREAIGISADALDRHLDKLQRRGLLQPFGQDPVHWRVSLRSRQPFRRQLWDLIRQELK